MKITRTERTRRLAELVKRIAPDPELEGLRVELESAVSGGGAESLESLTPSDDKIALESLDVIRAGDLELMRPDQTDALEAIVHRRWRPALFVVDDSYGDAPHPWDSILEGDARSRIEEAIPAVGRIELPNHPSLPYAGTGFIVGPGLLMTNRHVAANFVAGLADSVTFMGGQTAVVDFKEEQGSPDSHEFEIVKPLMVHPYWDMALLEVSGIPDSIAPLALSTQDTDELRAETNERTVVVIGYPAQSPYNDLADQLRIFKRFDVKRLQPGVLRERQVRESYGRDVNTVTHDCSTLGGNSGSALIDVATGRVVALHFAGIYLDANYAVPAFELAKDTRVVDAGVNFDGSLPPSDIYARVWKSSAQEGSAASQGVSAAPQTSSGQSLTASVSQGAGQAQWTIPLQVTVTLGEPRRGTGAAAVASDEGLFGRRKEEPGPEPVFHLDSLGSENFDWKAALSTAMASKLAYEDNDTVIAKATGAWGFSECAFLDVNRTQCFAAVADNVILVSFRGTKELHDWLTDLDIFTHSTDIGDVHGGFLDSLEVVEERLIELIGAQSERPVVITGHSLGGAIATIAGGRWANRLPIAGIYTFGQPAAGRGKKYRHAIRDLLTGRPYRIVNDDDVVAKVPPLYSHVGTLFKFDGKGRLKAQQESLAGEEMLSKAQFEALQAQISASAEAGSGAEGLLPSIRDHFMDHYVRKIAIHVASLQ